MKRVILHDSSGETLMLDNIYPVGSIYMSVNNADPGTLFGGTWARIKDRFLLSAGDTYNAGTTGGEAEHTLSQSELPNIHGEARLGWTDSSAAGIMITETSGALSAANTTVNYARNNLASGTYKGKLVFDVGGGAAHNNLPPYLAVYMWQRTA